MTKVFQDGWRVPARLVYPVFDFCRTFCQNRCAKTTRTSHQQIPDSIVYFEMAQDRITLQVRQQRNTVLFEHGETVLHFFERDRLNRSTEWEKRLHSKVSIVLCKTPASASNLVDCSPSTNQRRESSKPFSCPARL